VGAFRQSARRGAGVVRTVEGARVRAGAGRGALEVRGGLANLPESAAMVEFEGPIAANLVHSLLLDGITRAVSRQPAHSGFNLTAGCWLLSAGLVPITY
jgi:hypothetical protein